MNNTKTVYILDWRSDVNSVITAVYQDGAETLTVSKQNSNSSKKNEFYSCNFLPLHIHLKYMEHLYSIQCSGHWGIK